MNEINGVKSKNEIFNALLYFDLFKHPLTIVEIHSFLNRKITLSTLRKELNQMVANEAVFQFEEFYSIQNKESVVKRRRNARVLAKQKRKVADHYSKIIASFPFVKAVFLSGTISKGVMYSDSDIDYFIITKPGRLWLVKSMLSIYKRIALSNSYKNFCTNYFIDSDHLVIEDKNLFTATEIATLVPKVGYKWYLQFMRANHWINDFFPNFQLRNNCKTVEPSSNKFKKLFEVCLDNPVGKMLDSLVMKIYRKRYQKLYRSRFGDRDFELAFRSQKYISKGHPLNYQKRVLTAMSERLNNVQHIIQT